MARDGPNLQDGYIAPSVATVRDDANVDQQDSKIETHKLTALAVCLGFGQGCGLSFYVGSGGYYGDLFQNPRFFIYLCAFFYLPPILITAAAVLFDRTFDVIHGARIALQFRIYLSTVMVGCLLIGLCICSGGAQLPYVGEAGYVVGLGAALGVFAAVFLSSSCALLGALNPRMVPIVILAQTAAGVYTNVVARLIGFEPGCDGWRVQLYWAIAASSVLVVIMIFGFFNISGGMERSYQFHETLLASTMNSNFASRDAGVASQMRDASALPEPAFVRNASPGGTTWLTVAASALPGPAFVRNASPGSTDPLSFAFSPSAPPVQGRPIRSSSGRSAISDYPLVCWSMALCQSCAIAMNMSLTPLANQIAQGSYDLTQALVLTKLLSDFVGRTIFFFLPKPERELSRSKWCLRSIRGSALAVWLVETLRLPLWVMVYLRATHGDFRSHGLSWINFLGNKEVLLWCVWLPLISTGAMTSSWCSVVAITAVSDEQRVTVNVIMIASIYAGYFIGISIAFFS